LQLGQDLEEYLSFFREIKSKGLTIDDALELKTLSSKAAQLSQLHCSLTNQVSRLETLATRLSSEIDSKSGQIRNLNIILHGRNIEYQELSRTHATLQVLLDSITTDDKYRKFETLVKRESESLLVNRRDVLVLAMNAILVTLIRQPNPKKPTSHLY
jgi:hypothetical protein